MWGDERQKHRTGKVNMKSISASDIAEMPIQQRIQLVEDIWDSIADMPEAVEIPHWHKQELEKRLEAYHADPSEGSPWQDIKKRILG
jgi:putative addiction module component (TIGR02574 family)